MPLRRGLFLSILLVRSYCPKYGDGAFNHVYNNDKGFKDDNNFGATAQKPANAGDEKKEGKQTDENHSKGNSLKEGLYFPLSFTANQSLRL